jgi:hypothetical protein
MLHNEIIRKCFIKANGSIEVDGDNVLTYAENLDVEKFAKLIIQECKDVCEKLGRQGDGHYCADMIVNRFK